MIVLQQAARMLLLPVSICLLGCYAVRSESVIPGKYELTSSEEGSITLILEKGHTFRELITFANGNTIDAKGQWEWQEGTIQMDPLWIPPVFAPEYIFEADRRAAPGQPKYTEPINTITQVEWNFGRIIIPIYPDSDIEFRKVGAQ